MIKKKLSFFLFLSFIHTIFGNSSDNKSFTIVIPSYNNKKWLEHNLASALSQEYDNFNIIYTDDCSPDGTAEAVEEYLKLHDKNNKVTLIKNTHRLGALYNLYRMINMCDDDTIIVTLDGDDWFPDEKVLARLNEVYSSQDVWLTYGQFSLYPSETVGWASEMPDYIVETNTFRDFQHLPTHLRTFYSWLFKQIKLEDLLYLGEFYPMTWDMVMMFPMIEMAGARHKFIPDIMYIYNDANSISDHHVSRQLQAHLAQVVRKKNRYKTLSEKPTIVQNEADLQANMIIFAQTPDSLAQLIESLELFVQGLNTVSVLYQPSAQTQYEYDIIIKNYPHVHFYYIDEYRTNFKETLFNLYQNLDREYVLFSKGDACFASHVSLSECIKDLERTSAYAFYFSLNTLDAAKNYPLLSLIEAKEHVFAWDFSLARDKWSSANSLDLVLHKKRHSLTGALTNYYDLTPNGLTLVWSNEGNLNRLGLCFDESKITILL